MSTNLFPATPAVQHLDDITADLVIIEQTDMVIANRNKIVIKYLKDKSEMIRNQSFPYAWLTKEIGKNISGNTVYIKTISVTNHRPSWLPAIDVLEGADI
jgi:hypothetical protein